ncbi:carboxymuconolactone decarboxylase family protein [Streptomyces sp. AJS327]|uniref:carboxymuconolactone decarboxylase family protein n=1 Tax=Streptomyces sp. AJS327 TaxID=2545265 RepID=UPI0015DDDD2D|nr:carboxymuconolactone decarboxylase family protein [Streptomyces sp. AJS327]MBA0050470.1 carboxymuconolactone decarboxylase family protein [Streptomyces sp. AJS327]
MARISLDPPRGLVVRIAEWYSRRRFGARLDPLAAAGHHPRALLANAVLEAQVERWKALDPGLKHLAVMVSAARIGCSWCVDFGYWEAEEKGLPLERVRHVPQWRAHRGLFGELELLVMEYAEAMTETEPAVTDELAAELLERLGEPAFVELTLMVAVENLRSRANSAFGLTGQGFSDRCSIPLRSEPVSGTDAVN